MTREVVTRITTVDGKTYEYPRDSRSANLWEVRMSIGFVNQNGRADSMSEHVFVYVERSVLENAGLVPMCQQRHNQGHEPVETAEDLLLRLLSHLGVYPTAE